MEHESTTTIPVPPDRLYRAIAEIGNLSKLIPPITSVRQTDPEHVEVAALYEGHERQGDAWLRTDEQARRVEWGSDAHPYRGWLQVDPEGDGSRLTLHLTTSDVDDIEEYVTSTFESIRNEFSDK
jgi:hypothetical protein